MLNICLTTRWSGMICLTSPLKKVTVIVWPSTLMSFLVPFAKEITREPSLLTFSTWKYNSFNVSFVEKCWSGRLLGYREDWIRALLWKRDLTLTAPFSDRSSNVNSACELKNKPDKYFSFFLSFFLFSFFFLGGGGGEGDLRVRRIAWHPT